MSVASRMSHIPGPHRPIHSGPPLRHKVVVQHRSDMLMEEQISNVKNVQDALKKSLNDLERAKGKDAVQFHTTRVKELRQKSEEMVLVLQAVDKINTELVFARIDLEKSFKYGGDVNVARKRVGWLEDRMEILLGKKRQRSPSRAVQASNDASPFEDPRYLLHQGTNAFLDEGGIRRIDPGYSTDYSSEAFDPRRMMDRYDPFMSDSDDTSQFQGIYLPAALAGLESPEHPLTDIPETPKTAGHQRHTEAGMPMSTPKDNQSPANKKKSKKMVKRDNRLSRSMDYDLTPSSRDLRRHKTDPHIKLNRRQQVDRMSLASTPSNLASVCESPVQTFRDAMGAWEYSYKGVSQEEKMEREIPGGEGTESVATGEKAPEGDSSEKEELEEGEEQPVISVNIIKELPEEGEQSVVAVSITDGGEEVETERQSNAGTEATRDGGATSAASTVPPGVVGVVVVRSKEGTDGSATLGHQDELGEDPGHLEELKEEPAELPGTTDKEAEISTDVQKESKDEEQHRSVSATQRSRSAASSSSGYSGTTDDEGTVSHSQYGQVTMTEGSHISAGTRRSKSSRVTIKTPTEMGETLVDQRHSPGHNMEVERDEALEYWYSEHHRFEYNELAKVMCEIDPLSYHSMSLAVPGTFVGDGSEEPEVPLPWRIRRKGSDIEDVHKTALDKLAVRVHRMYDKVYDAAMLSVDSHYNEETATGLSLMHAIDQPPSTSKSEGKREEVDLSLRGPPSTCTSRPGIAKHTGLPRPSSKDTIVFPPLKKERLGTSLSGRLLYYPNPLPYPEKLPVTKETDKKEYPPVSSHFSSSVPGKDPSAERMVDQRNLLEETKFTSSLYRQRKKISSPTTSERKFRRLLAQDKALDALATMESDYVKKPVMRKALNMARTLVRLSDDDKDSTEAGGTWRYMKPKSGALEHSGLKWERVKSIVHHNLVAPNVDERVDAAKHLAEMRCGDAMVLYALRERLSKDDNKRVTYEAAKALITLGSWEEGALALLGRYLVKGSREVRADIIKTMINGKNVQYVNKKMQSFSRLANVLSIMCQNHDAEDMLSFDAAVLLGKLCVSDDNAKHKLESTALQTKDTHVRAQALDIVVRQYNCTDWEIIHIILEQLRVSPVWKHRKDAVKLLSVLGPKHVCVDTEVERVYDILERRLWDDPNKNVRQEVAKTLASIGMFPRACERVEKRLEDTSEDARAQAVISLGTLGMKNERILRTLLEMMELDASEYVRLMIIRTFATLGTQDKRVIRALRDKERGDGALGREAKKALKSLGVSLMTGQSTSKVTQWLTG